LEASTVSAGRGTKSPFLYFGAPWIRPLEIQVSVPGFELEPASFTPLTTPAAPDAKFLDQECHGMHVRVIDAAAAQSYRLGVELLVVLQGLEEFRWDRDGASLTRLVGTPRLIEDLRRGMTAEQIVAADSAAHDEWRRDRASSLLY
jgi:uncharacterized protein YbbC (DUF1343 family)